MKSNRWWAAGVAVLLGTSPAAAELQLKYAVIVSRHGVRAPTWDVPRLNEYSAQPWPEWGVAPAELTLHGRSLIKLMGGYYRDWLAGERLFPHEGCADAGRIYIWADTDQRTLETGRALAESILPGCGLAIHSRPEDESDPVFSGAGSYKAELALKAVRDRLGSDPQKLLADHREAFDTLQFILTGGQAARRKLIESPAEIGAAIGGKSVELKGPFATGSTLSENLLLEYTNGMEGAALGWGRLTKENLLRVLEIHGLYADLMRRTSYLARARGSNLLGHVLRAMEQAVSGTPVSGALGHPRDALLMLAGHDTNLSNLSGMLGLSWRVGGYQPDETPPGGALAFLLWRDSVTGQYFVKARFLAQTLDQMRNAVPLTSKAPPASQEISIPGCEATAQKTGCPWQQFRQTIQKAIDPEFTSKDL